MIVRVKKFKTIYNPTTGSPARVSASSIRCDAYPAPAKKSPKVTSSAGPVVNCPNSVITIAEFKKALPRQVNHNALMTILEYLEKSNKIVVGFRGMTWIHNPNKNLRNVVIYGREL
ncbi:hypothetical protein [Methanosarcina sp. WH1]|uniref:hypothetical protein n=1 Tax=Methanosarcina sp. WH1 TaxID=1434102 RepID=UPI0018CD66FC|nr:hypothetical protein [Methanosarcina sp. WH1]